MRPKSIHDTRWRSYPLRPDSFAYSLCVHFAVITALFLVGGPRPARPIYDELIRPQAHKLIFYDFRKKVPEVAPTENIGRSILPRGTQFSKRAVIATSPKPVSKTQSVFVPAPKIELPRDLPVPDLVARNASSLPVLPEPPKPARTPPKTFLPPPINRQPKLPVQQPIVDALAPSVNAPVALVSPVTNNGLAALSNIAAPRPEAPPIPTATPGNANVDAAIVSLDPSKNTTRTLPEGERPGEFSKAPNLGPASTGEVSPSALRVPNLSVRDSVNPTVKKPEDATSATVILYAERVPGAPRSTLSVPLRSATRTIPPAVDARFRGRNVYTIVVPIENMAVYSGDWIIWFSEREQKPGETPLMYAPVPYRKLEVVERNAAGSRLKQRLQIAAVLGKDGKLNNIAMVTHASPAADEAAVQDVASWEFKPATRNGTPIDVEVVVEIPFNLPISPTATTPP